MENFQRLLQHFMHFRNENIERLTKRDYCRLMARYLRDIYKQSPHQAMKFITQLKQFENIPLLLADFLEGRRNGPYALSAPEFTLADTLAQGTLQSGDSIITKAWHEEQARLEKMYRHHSSNHLTDEEN